MQRPFLVVGIGGPLILALVLLLTSRGAFVEAWNVLAARDGSLHYASFATAVGRTVHSQMPAIWDWHDTLGLMSPLSLMFIYTYAVAYVGGEVKRPEKNLLYSGWLAAGVTSSIAAMTFVGLYRMLDFSFLSAAAKNDLLGGVAGYHFPVPTNYMALAWIAARSNPIVGGVAALSFLLTSFWVLVISFLIAGRVWFAWGMDRMGPKWFADVHPRWASPIKTYFVCLLLCAGALAVYDLWFTNQMSGLIAAGMQLVSTFLLTALAALLLPYRRRAQSIWQASPYRRWTFAGLPLVSIAGLIYLAYVVLLLYFAFLDSRTRDVNGKNMIFLAGAWLAGCLWYMYWRRRGGTEAVDISASFGQLPPE